MAFDRQAKLAATNAISLADLELQFGEVGLENGPRVSPNKRSRDSNEAYLGRRLVLHLSAIGRLKFPVSVKHRDRPDFQISHADGEIFLEITEACPQEEGHEFAKLAAGQFDGPDEERIAIGRYSATGLAKARADLLDQIQESINSKASMDYASGGGVSLLVYPNSNAAQWVGFFERKPEGLMAGLDIRVFEALYVLWGDHFIELSGNRP